MARDPSIQDAFDVVTVVVPRLAFPLADRPVGHRRAMSDEWPCPLT